jgi:RND family efflux transporter MFP subunit
MLRLIFSIMIIGSILAGVAFGVKYAYDNRPKPEARVSEPRGLAVFVTQARMQDAALNINATGEATPRRDIVLASQVGGRVAWMAEGFESGGKVKRGELLMRIEDADYRLGVTRSRANVAQAQRALELQRAEAEIARREWSELGTGTASPLTLREPQLAEAEANLAAAQAALDDAELQLSRTRVTAPFDGVVRQKAIDVGQFVAPGQVAGQMFATDVMEVRLPLSDADLAMLGLPLAFNATEKNPGPKVTLSAVVAGQERFWQGHIARTDSAIDTSTRTLSAVAQVIDPYGAGADGDMPLAAGLFVNAVIEGRVVPDAFVLPRAALRGDNQVLVVKRDDATLDVRVVDVAYSDREKAILTAGVAEGEYVVTSPVLAPRTGMKVEAFDADDRALLFPPKEEKTEDENASAEKEQTNTARGERRG